VKPKDITIPEHVRLYERDYRLPDLLGTPRQVSWARLIRHDFLAEVLPRIVDAAAVVSPARRVEVFGALDRLRNDLHATRWIEDGRHNMGRAVEFILVLPKHEAAIKARYEAEAKAKTEQASERKRKAAEGRRLIAEAKHFENENNLPPLEGCSASQINFGRRARYLVLTARCEIDRTETLAARWIARYLAVEEALTKVIILHSPNS
jgi:hypothetical protein